MDPQEEDSDHEIDTDWPGNARIHDHNVGIQKGELNYGSAMKRRTTCVLNMNAKVTRDCDCGNDGVAGNKVGELEVVGTRHGEEEHAVEIGHAPFHCLVHEMADRYNQKE